MNTIQPVPPAPPFSLQDFLKTLAWQFARTVVVLLVVGVAILVGIVIPNEFAEDIRNMKPAGLAFGAATVLAVIRDLLQTLPTLFDYIKSAAASSLPRIFAQIAVATLGLGFAYFAATQDSSAERSLNLNVGNSLPPLVLNEGGSLFASYLIFPAWEAELPEGDRQFEQVDSLLITLAQCIQRDTDTVDLLVRAYASSSGTDAVNRKLYKARGAYVDSLLKGRIHELAPDREARFKIEVREWKSLEMMKIRRLFKDTDDKGRYLDDAGALNRRADILVRSAGSCLPG